MTTTSVPPVHIAGTLGRLYRARFGFAVVWAAAIAGWGGSLGAAVVALLVLYPAVDVAAAAADLRGTRDRLLVVNLVVSVAAAIALAIAAADDIAAVLRVWGAWAIVAGAVQLVVGLRRRALGGQWPMMASGGISVLAGLGFLGQAAGATSVRVLAGYAVLGGAFFLVAALRLRHHGLDTDRSGHRPR